MLRRCAAPPFCCCLFCSAKQGKTSENAAFRLFCSGDDDELLARASAVLKSQGPENWSRGRPGPHWARANSRSVRDTSCGKIRGGTTGGLASCGVTGPGCLWCSFLFVNGGRDLSQYTKGASSFGPVRPRSRGEPSPRQVAVGHLNRSVESSGQVRPPSRGQCAQMQLVAALPARFTLRGTIGVGWVGKGMQWSREAASPGRPTVALRGRR